MVEVAEASPWALPVELERLSSATVCDAGHPDARDEVPDWLDDAFDELNVAHFVGALTKPHMAVHPTPGATAAATVPVDDQLVVLFTPRLLSQDRRWATDTLLHEMVHIALIAENGDGDRAHAERFTNMANRIGEALGLPRVASESREALYWPQSVRALPYPLWEGEGCPFPWIGAAAERVVLVVEEDEPNGEAEEERELVVEEDVR